MDEWDLFELNHKDSSTLLVARVDCSTDGGGPVCRMHRLRRPSIQYGHPYGLLTDFKLSNSMGVKQFNKIAKKLKGVCSPVTLDLCTEEEQSKMQEYQDMD